MEALRAAVRTDLQAEAQREADARVRGELIDQIAAANNVSVPPSLLDRALAAYVAAYGVPEDQRGRFAGEFRPVAEAGVRRDLIIETVAEKAGLAASADARVRPHRRGGEAARRDARPPCGWPWRRRAGCASWSGPSPKRTCSPTSSARAPWRMHHATR